VAHRRTLIPQPILVFHKIGMPWPAETLAALIETLLRTGCQVINCYSKTETENSGPPKTFFNSLEANVHPEH
jgi:hypothetical protein